MILIPLTEWFYHSEVHPTVNSQSITDRFKALEAAGHDIFLEYQGVGFWRRYMGRFEGEAEAATFKLTHL